jgi:hypothetical protein
MSERETRVQAQSRKAMAGRFGARFWDGVESEIESLDPADLALFLGADRLDIEPRPAFERCLETHLRALGRRRWSN